MARLAFLLLPAIWQILAPAVWAREERDDRRTPVVRAVERSSPAVVNISASELYQEESPFTFFNDPFFEEFFNRYFESAPRSERSRNNLGSGLLFRRDGYVLTNHHVVAKAAKVRVSTSDGREFEARVAGADPQFDLAVLKIEGAADLPEAVLGDSDDLMVGETVVAIGNPFGLSNTITTGVISAVRRSIRAGGNRIYSDFIQTDASINPGNSGGPLVNIMGEVVGINTAIYQQGEGIGFAIPVNVAKKVVKELIQYGRVHRGWFGIFLQDLTPDLRASLRYGAGSGVLVSKVFPLKSSAELSPGDIITSLDGREVRGVSEFVDVTGGYLPGDEVRLDLFRDGKRESSRMTCRQMSREEGLRLAWDLLGLSLEKRGENTKGMEIRKVRENSYAARIGLARGDILLEIRDISLEKGDDLTRAVTGIIYQDRVPITLQRGRYLYHLTLRSGI